YVGPRTPVEELVAGIWGEVLGVERVGVHEDFFALGGHSLLATQVVARIRSSFGIELPLRTMFEASTVAALAAQVEQALGGKSYAAPPIRRHGREGELPLSFAQQRLWFLDQLEPGSAAYNMPGAVLIEGLLDVEALHRALVEIVQRHESLRTRFVGTGGEPRQIIDPEALIDLPITGLTDLSAEQREIETRR